MSAISLFSLGFYILNNPKLQMHPYPLISWIMITNSFLFHAYTQPISVHRAFCNEAVFWNFGFFKSECMKGTIYRLIVALGIHPGLPITLLNLTLNTLLFHDLYSTLRNPFKPRESRIIWYKVIAITLYVV